MIDGVIDDMWLAFGGTFIVRWVRVNDRNQPV